MDKYISEYIAYHPIRTQRGLEILTGLIPWSIILFPLIGSFFIPEIVAYFIILFTIYWFYRSIQTAINTTIGYLKVRAAEQTDWMAKLKTDEKTSGKFSKLYHLVIIPNVKEPLSALERNIVSLQKQTFSSKKIVVVLAMEQRAYEIDKNKPKFIVKKYAKYFKQIIVTWHPLVPGETIGKHSNNAYAGKIVKKILVDQKKIDIKRFILTSCDVDSVFNPQHMAHLTYKFLTAKKPYQHFFQPPFLMYNNVNRLPLFMRLRILMAGAGNLGGLQKISGRFTLFSTYSLSLWLLDKVGYWDVDVIPEDWHINLKSYFALKGDVDITPLDLPVIGDAPEAGSTWQTINNTYQTEKRWAWGVVDVPYVIKQTLLHPEIPLLRKLKKLLLTMEWHITWSSSWFLLTLGATIPTVVNPAFARTTLGYNLSRTSSLVLTLSIVGLIAMTLYGNLLNPHTGPKLRHKMLAFLHPLTFVQWLLLPVLGFVFGALPGLESETRLLLGKHIEYRVTEKKASQ